MARYPATEEAESSKITKIERTITEVIHVTGNGDVYLNRVETAVLDILQWHKDSGIDNAVVTVGVPDRETHTYRVPS